MNVDQTGPELLASDPLGEEFQFRALMENTEDSIYFKDRACRLMGVSLRMARNLGFTEPSELITIRTLSKLGDGGRSIIRAADVLTRRTTRARARRGSPCL